MKCVKKNIYIDNLLWCHAIICHSVLQNRLKYQELVLNQKSFWIENRFQIESWPQESKPSWIVRFWQIYTPTPGYWILGQKPGLCYITTAHPSFWTISQWLTWWEIKTHLQADSQKARYFWLFTAVCITRFYIHYLYLLILCRFPGDILIHFSFSFTLTFIPTSIL